MRIILEFIKSVIGDKNFEEEKSFEVTKKIFIKK